jgi:hypothetical protein
MILITENSTACAPHRGDAKARLERHGVVLQGKILKKSKVEQASIRYRVLVERIWKGSIQPGDVINLHTPGQGSTCGVHFEVGESYLIFADYEYWQHLSVYLSSGGGKTRDRADTIETLDQLIDGTAQAAPQSEPFPQPTEAPDRSDTPTTSLSPEESPGNVPRPAAAADSEPPTTSPPPAKREPSRVLVPKQRPAVPPPVERSERGCAVGRLGDGRESQSLFPLIAVLIFVGRRGLMTSLIRRPS